MVPPYIAWCTDDGAAGQREGDRRAGGPGDRLLGRGLFARRRAAAVVALRVLTEVTGDEREAK